MSSTEQQAPGIERTTPEGPSAGHWLAEQAPEQMLTTPTEILTLYRESRGESQ